MKGQIKKTDYGWIVACYYPHSEPFSPIELPLHPNDIDLFKQFEKVFDNFEARVLSDPEVDFEISIWSDGAVPKEYAKLKNTAFDRKEGMKAKVSQSDSEAEKGVESTIDKNVIDWLYKELFPKQLDGFSEEEWDKIDTAFKKAKQKFEQEIIDTWVASARYGLTEEYLNINSDEPKIAKVYYDNKYEK